MGREAGKVIRIAPEGEWSVKGISRIFPPLWAQLARLPAGSELVLDLSGLTDLDACGCQLLALLMRHLRGQGITGLCDGVSEELGATIHLLGYGQEIPIASPGASR